MKIDVINGMFVFPQNSYFAALTPRVNEFGDGAFKELIKVKCGCKIGALI